MNAKELLGLAPSGWCSSWRSGWKMTLVGGAIGVSAACGSSTSSSRDAQSLDDGGSDVAFAVQRDGGDAATDGDSRDLAPSTDAANGVDGVGVGDVGGDGALDLASSDGRASDLSVGDVVPSLDGRPDGAVDGASDLADGGLGASDAAATTDARSDAAAVGALAFYVSFSQGDDNGPGTFERPWKTLNMVSTRTFAPGSTIYLRRGDRWEDALTMRSSGTAKAPITYDAYGTGPAPTIVGSDPVAPTAWTPGQGDGIWTLSRAIANCVLENDAFLHSTYLLAGLTDDRAKNLAMLASTVGSFYADGQTLYVHTASDPRSNGKAYRVCARENLVYTNAQSYLVVRNLLLLDSAKPSGGYAAFAYQGGHITFEDIVAKRAGKHHVSAIETDAFLGRRLVGSEAMPDQGLGGATPFVHYVYNPKASFESDWIDCEAFTGNDPYPSFIVHGEGVGRLYLDNLRSHGWGPSLAPGKASAKIRMRGGLVDVGRVDVYAGDDVVIDGLVMKGQATIEIWGGNNTIVQNTTLTNGDGNWQIGWPGAIRTAAVGTKILFNTILNVTPNAAGVAIDTATAKGTVVVGNIISGWSGIRKLGSGTVDLVSNHNVFDVGTTYGTEKVIEPKVTLADWQAMGWDKDSWEGTPTFVNRDAGDLHPCAGSLGTALSDLEAVAKSADRDADGQPRPWSSYDIGAYGRRACPTSP